MVELMSGDTSLLFNDGVNLRYQGPGEEPPRKHQLPVEFEDGTSLSATVRMYGGLMCFSTGSFDNPYYEAAKSKPSPLTDAFDAAYFDALTARPEVQKLSLKACLATEQRIPGLGNGVLQDFLWKAGLHPQTHCADAGRRGSHAALPGDQDCAEADG